MIFYVYLPDNCEDDGGATTEVALVDCPAFSISCCAPHEVIISGELWHLSILAYLEVSESCCRARWNLVLKLYTVSLVSVS